MLKKLQELELKPSQIDFLHHCVIHRNLIILADLQKYSYVIFYDHDGTSAANIYSHIAATFSNLKAARVTKNHFQKSL